MSKHTPAPYNYSGSMNAKDLTIYSQADGIDQTLAMNQGPGYVATIKTREFGLDIKGTEAEATAQFIVTACNAHEDLLTALEEIVETAYNDRSHQAVHEIARAAVAKARGQ